MNDEFRRSVYAVMVGFDKNQKYADLSEVLDLVGSLDDTRNAIRFYGYLTDIYKFPIKQLTVIDEMRSINPAGIVSPTPFVQTAYVYTPRINEIQTWKNGKLVHLWSAGNHYSNRVSNLDYLTGATPPPDVCVSVVIEQEESIRVDLAYDPGFVYV